MDWILNKMTGSFNYKRVLLKISGEALMGDDSYGINMDVVSRIAADISKVHDTGVDICIVIGGGNIFRGTNGAKHGIERTTSDYIGMLATVMNGLAMQSALEKLNITTRVVSAITMDSICEPYIRRKAIRHMEKRRVVIFVAGTGNPFFTTDTAAALRAAEMNCDVLLKGTQVDGIYSSDPRTASDAIRYNEISYQDVLVNNLGIIDASAISLCRDNNIPILVFSLHSGGLLHEILNGSGVFTIVR